jgi:hypothetical protein
MATFNNEKYQIYANTLVSDVPLEYLRILITLFLDHSALNMGANVEKANVDRIIEIVQEDYNFLPINQIASAFVKGSMGYYGEGRLVPKIINGWLKEIRSEYIRFAEHNDRKNRIEAQLKEKPYDLQKYPAGKAICKKIDWYRAGLIDMDDWDKIPLKAVAEIIGRGHIPTIEDFGIEPIKTK